MSFTTNRMFGLELELIVDKTKLFKALDDCHIPYVWFDKQRTPKQDIVVIKPEGTIKGVGGIEINFPPTFSFDLIQIVIEILHSLDVFFSDNCAMHVHIDVSDIRVKDFEKIQNYYVQYQDQIINDAKLHGVYLDLNERVVAGELDIFKRRFNLNIKPSIMRHGTIEHRIYKSTIDTETIWFCIQQSVDIINNALNNYENCYFQTSEL